MSDFLTLLVVLSSLWGAVLVWPGGARRVAAWWRYADRGDGSNGAGGDAIAALVFATVLVVIIALVMASKWLYDVISAI